ncbi:unnamed protein product [Rotaria magnacalcarata]|uniref:Uncharacterized protein n=1 Tax=Rotaria magnacalcarata TaxID=392030 RepID=A0A8S2K286_9BILA|nr:unnamed protein product [Rotaria magnacalcarata]
MDPTPKRRGRPRKSNVVPNTETIKPNVEKTKKKKPNDEPSVPKIENLLTMNAMVVQQRKAAKVKKKSAKRKSLAIRSKDQTESWGNYRNTIDNGPVPQHPLTLNETAFDVALKLQRRNQDRQLAIDYLDNENEIEFIKDSKMTEQVLTDTYPIQLSQNVCRTKSIT